MEKIIRRLFFALACLTVSGIAGQTPAKEKETIIVDYFAGARNVPFACVEQVRGGVIKAFVDRGRHRVVDAATIQDLQMAANGMQAHPWGAPGDWREQQQLRARSIRALGARYVVAGTVTDCVWEAKGKDRLLKQVDIALSVYDLQTGTLVDTQSWQLSQLGDTPKKIDEELSSQLSLRTRFFIDRYFKFQTDVLQLEAPNAKGKYKELYLRCGSSMGVRNGDLFKIYRRYSLFGEAAEQLLGKVRARQVCGENITRCSISSGAEAIAQAFAQGDTLVAVSDGQALF